MKKKAITAAELMAELQDNPEYLRSKEIAEQKRLQINDEILFEVKPILQELDAEGFSVENVDQLILKYAPIPKQIVNILMPWLLKIKNKNLLEMIVRAIGTTREKYNGVFLTQLFEQSESEILQWTISNTIAESRPENIENWLFNKINDDSLGMPKQMLFIAAARLLVKEKALEFFKEHFDEAPGHVAPALGEIGSGEELQFLGTKESEYNKGWVAKEIRKAMKKIEKRLK